MSGFITYDNFWEEVKLYCHSQAKKADGLGFILSKIDSPEAQAWIAYCHDKGWPQRAAYFEKMLKQGNSLTMPCADPRKFEPGYVPGKKPSEARREHVTTNLGERHSIAEQVRAVVANSKPPRDRKREDWKPEPKTFKEVCDEFNKNPPKMSPALAAMISRDRQEAAE